MLFAEIILSWVPIRSNSPVVNQAIEALHSLTEPFLKLFRRLLPTASFGQVGIDFSPIIAFIVLGVVKEVVVKILIEIGL